MAINPAYLARAVVNWTEFEIACFRGNLLSEAHLAQPIGQVLNARSKNPVVPEFPHPILKNPAAGRPKAIDFVIQTRNESVITHATETKWITDKRDFKQEIFDDLARLELVHVENRPLSRWMLIAGKYSQLRESIFEAEGNAGAGLPRVRVFNNVLPTVIGTKVTVPIRDSILPSRRFWKKSNEDFGVELPISLTVTLEAVHPASPTDDSIACYIWQVGRVGRRSIFSF